MAAKEVLLSDAPGGGGGGFEAPPPPGGLGNFKGVMLCNRPSEVPIGKLGDGVDGSGERPFKSTVSATYNEQIGLNPPHKEALNTEPHVQVSEAMQRHGVWLKELGQKVREEKAQVAKTAEVEGEKKAKLADFCQRQRDAVKEVLMDVKNLDDPAEKQKLKEELTEAVQGKSSKKKAKPLWAMTEAQKDEFEEEEAGGLIDFAEGLDFDQFIHDLEFREAVGVLKDRAGKLQKEQDDFKALLVDEFNRLPGAEDDEDADQSPTAARDLEDGIEGTSLQDTSEGDPDRPRRRKQYAKKLNEDGRPEWDASTTAGSEAGEKPDEKVREVADRALEDRSMKQIHSKESVQKIIEKQKEKQILEDQKKAVNLMALVDHLEAEGSAPNPVIAISSDVLGRANRPKDPSMLPYLYRSPAV